MTVVHDLLCIGWLAVGLAPSISAQTLSPSGAIPSEVTIESRLHSEDSRLVAWEHTTLAPDFGNDVAILLARMPVEGSGPLSFDFYRSPPEKSHGLEYVGAALLALHPLPGFAADLLANTRVRSTVWIVLPDWGFGSVSDGCFGSFAVLRREDWPATGQYILSKPRSDRAPLVVSGIDPIYVNRIESTVYLGDLGNLSVYMNPNDRLRLSLLSPSGTADVIAATALRH